MDRGINIPSQNRLIEGTYKNTLTPNLMQGDIGNRIPVRLDNHSLGFYSLLCQQPTDDFCLRQRQFATPRPDFYVHC
jgi:hypothetical protein